MEKDELNAITGKLYSAAVTYERSIFAVIESINELIKQFCHANSVYFYAAEGSKSSYVFYKMRRSSDESSRDWVDSRGKPTEKTPAGYMDLQYLLDFKISFRGKWVRISEMVEDYHYGSLYALEPIND